MSPAVLSPADFVSRDEAAAILGVRPQTLAVWATTHRYHLPYIRVGNRVRYRLADLEAWLSSRTQTGTAVDSEQQEG